MNVAIGARLVEIVLDAVRVSDNDETMERPPTMITGTK